MVPGYITIVNFKMGGVGGGRGFSWGGVEGWGEKVYNCNGITIKI